MSKCLPGKFLSFHKLSDGSTICSSAWNEDNKHAWLVYRIETARIEKKFISLEPCLFIQGLFSDFVLLNCDEIWLYYAFHFSEKKLRLKEVK